MKVFILIYQNPLRIKAYSSLTALLEDNTREELGVSRSTLEKHDFNYNYISSKVIIAKRITQTSGDIRRKQQEQQ